MRGFTLTEAAIVLGIVGLILGAIWVAAGAVYSNLRVETANKQLMSVVQNVRSLYSSSTQMDAIAAGDLVRAGVFPPDTNPNAATGNGTNGWGGAITVARGAAAAGTFCPTAGDCFMVGFAGVPMDACIKMAVGNAGQGRDSGLAGVGAAQISDGAATVGVNATPNRFITTGCAAGQTLTFTFRLKG